MCGSPLPKRRRLRPRGVDLFRLRTDHRIKAPNRQAGSLAQISSRWFALD